MNFQEFIYSKGVTQTQLGDAIGRCRAHVSLWATGESFPRPKSINKIVQGFAKLGIAVTYDEVYASLLTTKREKGE